MKEFARTPSEYGFTRPISFSRHDQHNLEFKVALACPENREDLVVDLFLFLPNTLNLQSWSRQELRQDFHSRLRLAVQQSALAHEASLRGLSRRVRELLQTFLVREDQVVLDEIFQKTREFGAVLGETLKHESRRLRGELLLAVARSNLAPHPKQMVDDVQKGLERIDALVANADDLCLVQGAADLPVIRLLRQYINHLYMDFLVRLCQEQTGMGEPNSAETRQAWLELKSEIARLRLQEARRFQNFTRHEGEMPEWNEELGLLRFSQIKKFFQSQMFIEVHRKETLRRFSEPAAAGAAAFAAMWAGAFEYFSAGKLHAVGMQGVVVICLGVALYVLKDRLKDQFRTVFTKKLAKILPEAEQSLMAEGRKVGRVREWFTLRGLCDLPMKVLELRRAGDLTEAECHLPEEVLHYGQEFQLEPSSTSYGEFERSIQQVVRINIERFLKRLDDPYKTVRLFDGEGELKLIRSRRIYHFHAAVVVRRRLKSLWWSRKRAISETVSEGLYRVVVDKSGVERVVSVP